MLSLLALLALLAPGARAAELRLVLNPPDAVPAPVDTCEQEVCLSLVQLIDSARTSVDFAIYGMRNQGEVLAALQRAGERGVRIRGVVDRDVDDRSYYSGTDALMEALGTVRTDHASDSAHALDERRDRTGTYRCDRPIGFAGPVQCVELDLGERCLFASHASREPIVYTGDIMHDKFFLVDGRWLWTGSTNVSDSGTGGYNANSVVVLSSRRVVRWYTAELEQMYEDGLYHRDKRAHGPRRARLSPDLAVDVYFSPQDRPMAHGVRPVLQRAERRIDVAVFFLTHPGVAQDLIDAHNRGVRVRVILDATAARNGYTKHELLRAAGVPVKVEDWGGKMHSKTAVVDGERVIVGSMNWTSAGEAGNDENTLIIESAAHAAQVEAWFEAMWRSIPDEWLRGRPDPESTDSGRSCYDGVDNDFDDRIDQEDPGCRRDPPPLSALPPHRVVPKAAGYGLVKGVTLDGQGRVFVRPGDSGYEWVRVDPDRGDAWYCTEWDARRAGYRPHLR